MVVPMAFKATYGFFPLTTLHYAVGYSTMDWQALFDFFDFFGSCKSKGRASKASLRGVVEWRRGDTS